MRWIVLLLCLCGCGSSPDSPLHLWMEDNGKLKVLSTTAMIDDLVGQIGEERIDHLALITGEMDPHSYEIVKGDEEKFSCASIIFFNGLGLEHGASLRAQLHNHPHAVALGSALPMCELLQVEGQIDPHVWMDISLWAQVIPAIVDNLSKKDPQGAEIYQKNGAALKEKMLEKHGELVKRMQSVPAEKRYLVTSHDAYDYFCRSYLASPGEKEWQQRFSAPEGLAPDAQLSAVDIQKVIDHLSKYNIQVIFPESNVSKDSLKKIVSACREKGLKVEISTAILYGDAMGKQTYLEMIEHNIGVLFDAWK